MVPSIRTTNIRDENFTASYSRSDDWHACCARVMGLDEWVLVDPLIAGTTREAAIGDNQTVTATTTLQVTNLLPSELFEDDDDDDNNDDQQQRGLRNVDPWTENALNIQADLERMANWIQSKKWSFVSFDSMRDDEASLIQSTVTSFAATTANDIESLRKMTLSSAAAATTTKTKQNSTNNAVQHRTGIVQILFARLKEDIVEPFGVLQKHRSRKAVSLWQNPLQCKLLVKTTNNKPAKRKRRDELDQALGLDGDDDDDDRSSKEDEIKRSRREQRFLPSRDTHQMRNNFMETYERDEHLAKRMERPKSLIRDPLSVLSSETETVFRKNSPDGDNKYTPSHQQQQQQQQQTIGNSRISNNGIPDYQVTQEMSEAAHQQMQQEALLLQTMVNSDLDSVQKMEQQMVSITTLLTQFSDLVSEQQEEVWQIHDTAKETKDNIDKGQDALVDAAEQTYKSGNYMAKGIFSMGCLLLLFHWLRP